MTHHGLRIYIGKFKSALLELGHTQFNRYSIISGPHEIHTHSIRGPPNTDLVLLVDHMKYTLTRSGDHPTQIFQLYFSHNAYHKVNKAPDK